MTKNAKLKSKLKDGSINGRDLRTLLQQEGWLLERTRGSHEVWTKEMRTFVLATHSKELKPYQIREARMLLTEGTTNEE